MRYPPPAPFLSISPELREEMDRYINRRMVQKCWKEDKHSPCTGLNNIDLKTGNISFSLFFSADLPKNPGLVTSSTWKKRSRSSSSSEINLSAPSRPTSFKPFSRYFINPSSSCSPRFPLHVFMPQYYLCIGCPLQDVACANGGCDWPRYEAASLRA